MTPMWLYGEIAFMYAYKMLFPQRLSRFLNVYGDLLALLQKVMGINPTPPATYFFTIFRQRSLQDTRKINPEITQKYMAKQTIIQRNRTN